AFVLTISLAYSSAFLLPGSVLVVFLSGGKRRAGVLLAVAGITGACVYWIFLRPNLSPQLREFWSAGPDTGITRGLAVALAFCLIAVLRLGIIYGRGKFSPRDLVQLLCVMPCLLLAAAGFLGVYPVSPRTRLF